MRARALCFLFVLGAAGWMFPRAGAAVPPGGPAAQTQAEAASVSADLPQAAQQALAAVSPERIRAHTKFLSSDGLEGRGHAPRRDEMLRALGPQHGRRPGLECGTMHR